jgi:2-methylcitrate dehydratase PrpD
MDTKQIVNFITDTDITEMPPEVIEAAKRGLLDYFSVVLAGSKEQPTTIVGEYAKCFNARPEATIVGHKLKTEVSLAALVNGTCAHALDYDDFTIESGHPTATTGPAVLALGERHHVPGKSVLEAYIVGLEVSGKIGALIGLPQYELGWHTTGTMGTIGAAAAAAKLLRLDAQKTSTSIGIAASLASGLRQNFGTMTKPLHAGRAAQNGVIAACLAERGFTASEEALEGVLGFGRAFTGGRDLLRNRNLNLGAPYSLISPGLNVKLYPSCATTHCGIEAVLDLCKQHTILPADIAEVELITHPMIPEVVFHHDPRTPTEARFSYEYCVARALVSKKLSLDAFTPDAILEPQMKEIISKIHFNIAASSREAPYHLRADVIVKMQNGTVYKRHIEEAKGNSRNPLTIEELEGKFRDCAHYTLRDEGIEKVLGLILNMDRLSDIGDLMRLLN